MIYLSITYLAVLLPAVLAVLEQARDRHGNYIWRMGSYRNRNEVPRPRGLDLEKKHKRDIDGTHPNTNSRSQLKKSFIKNHFSLPLGAEIPISYSEKLKSPHGKKKSDISTNPSDDKFNNVEMTKRSEIEKERKPLSELLLDDDDNEHGEFKPLNIRTNMRSRSKINGGHEWGMVWHDPYPNPEEEQDSQGYGRSTLAGTGNFKISEEEFDSGLMGRGLGGMKERAQNENLMQGKFAEKISDESDVEMENRNLRRM